MWGPRYKSAKHCLDLQDVRPPIEVQLLYAGELARDYVKGELTPGELYAQLQKLDGLSDAHGGQAAMGLIDSQGEYWDAGQRKGGR